MSRGLKLPQQAWQFNSYKQNEIAGPGKPRTSAKRAKSGPKAGQKRAKSGPKAGQKRATFSHINRP